MLGKGTPIVPVNSVEVIGLQHEMTSRVVGGRRRANFQATPLPMRCFLALFLALTAHSAPVSLFDGKTLSGWEGDAAWWRVEAGEIRGGSLTTKVPKNFFLATEKSYQNFDLRVKLRLTQPSAVPQAKPGMPGAGYVRTQAMDWPANLQ